MDSSATSESPRDNRPQGDLGTHERQVIALEQIAESMQALRGDLRAIHGALLRIVSRGGHED